jgi:hypothetical protein
MAFTVIKCMMMHFGANKQHHLYYMNWYSLQEMREGQQQPETSCTVL